MQSKLQTVGWWEIMNQKLFYFRQSTITMLTTTDDSFITLSKPIMHSMRLRDNIDVLRSEYLRTHRLALGPG